MSKSKSIKTNVIFPGRSENRCWFAPTATLIPASRTEPQRILITAHLLTGNDIGIELYSWSFDMGASWSNPTMRQNTHRVPLENDVYKCANLRPFYHYASRTLLGIGRTYFVKDVPINYHFKGEMHTVFADVETKSEHQFSLVYSIWDERDSNFLPPRHLDVSKLFPEETVLTNDGQRYEEKDGSILMPISCGKPGTSLKVGTIRLCFDGKDLTAVETGNLIGKDIMQGLCEPSIVQFSGRYYLTLRSEYNDSRMYNATSDDGLNWSDFKPWCWDDGEPVDTRNTQQHWLKHGKSLYLVYTRTHELNNGVVRNRAPLFMAKVDTSSLSLIRSSEEIVFPEKGARMGNFCTLSLSENEGVIFTGEWLQQLVPGYHEGMPFFVDNAKGESPYNRIQYIGDLMMARIKSE